MLLLILKFYKQQKIRLCYNEKVNKNSSFIWDSKNLLTSRFFYLNKNLPYVCKKIVNLLYFNYEYEY